MSGLLVRSHMNAGQDGFRDASSKQWSGTIRDVALVNETVSGSGYNVGGLVGFNNGGGISASYATGNVSGSYKVGGLVGTNSGGTTNASYWDTNSSGQTGSAGGGQPLH